MQTTADPLVGRALEGRYRLRERIARGGMSTVYSALDERLDREVAVKIMSESLTADPAFGDRFAREARAAARLTHLNAVAVFDQGVEYVPGGKVVFLVMELVSGRTLRDLLRERGRLTQAEALSIMEPVLGALASAHRAGLVHRDIKPENILLSDDGVVKVADFGLARAVETPEATSRTGLMMGTVAYCSPEQITRGRTDQRCDVYSAGIVLFELLTGEAPYVGDSAVEVAYQHVHSQVPAPSSRIPDIPPEIDELVIRATANDPGGRPLDAGAFLAELADARTDLDLPVTPVPRRPRLNGSAPARGGRPELRTTDRLGSGFRTHDTMVDGPGSLAPVAPAAPRPAAGGAARQFGVTRRHRRRRALIIALVLVLLGSGIGFGSWWLVAGRYTKVPDVSGLSLQDARASLGHRHFVLAARTSAFSETIPAGSVVSTEPSAGSREKRGTRVTLVLSKGKERFTLADVKGKTESEARRLLAAIPIEVFATQASDDTVPKGRIIRTDPPAGTLLRRAQRVALVVSSGPPIVSVPDVGGKTQQDATDDLTGAGFRVQATQAFSDTVPDGSVISQQPGKGDTAVKFSTVTITVSKGPEFVIIPTIPVGTSGDTAQAQLEKLGLVVKVQHSFGSPFGNFVAIDPPAGTRVHRGDTVTIYVV